MAFPSTQWSYTTTYTTNDRVNYGGLDYYSLVTGNLNQVPSATVGTKWQVFTDWAAGTTYSINQISIRNGIGYESVVNTNLNHDPATAANIGPWWQRVVVRFNFISAPYTIYTSTTSALITPIGLDANMITEPGAQPLMIPANPVYTILLTSSPMYSPGPHLVTIGRVVFRIPRVSWFTGLGSRANQPETLYNQE